MLFGDHLDQILVIDFDVEILPDLLGNDLAAASVLASHSDEKFLFYLHNNYPPFGYHKEHVMNIVRKRTDQSVLAAFSSERFPGKTPFFVISFYHKQGKCEYRFCEKSTNFCEF